MATVAPPMFIEDVRIYDAVLTLEQLDAVRLANYPPPLWWDLDGATPGAGGGGALAEVMVDDVNGAGGFFDADVGAAIPAAVLEGGGNELEPGLGLVAGHQRGGGVGRAVGAAARVRRLADRWFCNGAAHDL